MRAAFVMSSEREHDRLWMNGQSKFEENVQLGATHAAVVREADPAVCWKLCGLNLANTRFNELPILLALLVSDHRRKAPAKHATVGQSTRTISRSLNRIQIAFAMAWPALVEQGFHNPALIFESGFPLFVAGLAIVRAHNHWKGG
jgi:hypothetical protein